MRPVSVLSRASLFVATALALTACLDLVVPQDTSREAGEVTLTVLIQRPGRSELQPAPGATLTLVGTSQSATADTDGNVRLTDLQVTTGSLRLEWDADDDGAVDAARVFDLQTVGGGFGKRVSLGIVVLGRLATVQGKVLRGDRMASTAGHGGIQVFVPASPNSAVTADDGSYVLNGVPEGELPISYYASGYAPTSSRVTVAAGQSLTLETVVLQTAPVSDTGRIRGTVRDSGGSPLQAVAVTVETSVSPLRGATDAIGGWEVSGVPAGLVNLVFKKDGFVSVRIPNFLVQAGVSTQDVTLTAGVDPTEPPPVRDAGTVDAGLADAGLADAGVDGGSVVVERAGPLELVSPVTLLDGGASFGAGVSAQPGDLAFLVLKLGMGTSTFAVEPSSGWGLVFSGSDSSTEAPIHLYESAIGPSGSPALEFGTNPSLISGFVASFTNASRARVSLSRFVNGSASPSFDPSFPPVVSRPGDRVLNIETTGFFGDVCDAGVPMAEFRDFRVASVTVPDSGISEPVLIQCGMPASRTQFQVVISGR